MVWGRSGGPGRIAPLGWGARKITEGEVKGTSQAQLSGRWDVCPLWRLSPMDIPHGRSLQWLSPDWGAPIWIIPSVSSEQSWHTCTLSPACRYQADSQHKQHHRVAWGAFHLPGLTSVSLVSIESGCSRRFLYNSLDCRLNIITDHIWLICLLGTQPERAGGALPRGADAPREANHTSTRGDYCLEGACGSKSPDLQCLCRISWFWKHCSYFQTVMFGPSERAELCSYLGS